MENPFRTLVRAQAAIRQVKAEQAGIPVPVTVWVHGGRYEISTTLELDGRDSGTVEAPVSFVSWEAEKVIFSGGRSLAPSWFRPVQATDEAWDKIDAFARSNVLVADLGLHGITDFGTLRPRGFEQRAPSPAELSVNGTVLRLARWPNLKDPLARTTAPLSGLQLSLGERVSRWSGAKEIWLHGLWSETWADFHLKVTSVQAADRTVTLANGPAQFGLQKDRPYYAYNLLEELDEQGEYFIDREKRLIYAWPPPNFAAAVLSLSTLEQPLIRIAGANNVVFTGLTLEGGRGGLVEVAGGTGIRMDHCSLRDAGQVAVVVDGERNLLERCEITGAGEEGVILRGGNRAQLLAGGNQVTDSVIRECGRIGWSYKPAVNLDGGCSNRVAHNLISDLPHSAILLKGDRHVIEDNEITGVCSKTGDAGAIYSGHDWGYRGNVIQRNFLHHISSAEAGHGVHGVYLDDCMSGTTVRSNIFYAVSHTAIFLGGGRDNLVESNIIARSGRAHFNDDRGRNRITDVPGDYWNLLERLNLEGINYRGQPRAAAFPECAAIPSSWEGIQDGLWRNPENCVFDGNYGWDNGEWMVEYNESGTGVFSVYRSVAGNVSQGIPAINEAQALNRALRAERLVVSVPGFAPLPFSAIGPRPDEARPPTAGNILVARAAGSSQWPAVTIEAEAVYQVKADVGINGSIGVSDGERDSHESVRLYDVGDNISLPFELGSDGEYSIELRVRSGGTTGKKGFWPDGYRGEIEGNPLALVGLESSISELDNAYGGSYWGTLSALVSLSAGKHDLSIEAKLPWAVVDYVKLTRLR